LEGENYLSTFYKKSESENLVYLVYSKRGYDGKKCSGKVKFDRNNCLI